MRRVWIDGVGYVSLVFGIVCLTLGGVLYSRSAPRDADVQQAIDAATAWCIDTFQNRTVCDRLLVAHSNSSVLTQCSIECVLEHLKHSVPLVVENNTGNCTIDCNRMWTNVDVTQSHTVNFAKRQAADTLLWIGVGLIILTSIYAGWFCLLKQHKVSLFLPMSSLTSGPYRTESSITSSR